MEMAEESKTIHNSSRSFVSSVEKNLVCHGVSQTFVVFFSHSCNFFGTASKQTQVTHAREPFYHPYCEHTGQGMDKHIY
jgi:hypothetical protein